MSTEFQPEQLPPCDLVMKGGSTSGIVYPPVIAELSRKYRFSSIGGTSAGAIAAAVTASAEYGRQRGHIRDFSLLNQLSDDLTQSGRLLELFRSTAPPHLRPVLDTLLPLVSNVTPAAESEPAEPALAGAALAVAERIAPEMMDLLMPLPASDAEPVDDTVSKTLRNVLTELPNTHPQAHAAGAQAGVLAGSRVGQYLVIAALLLSILFALPLFIARATLGGWIMWAILAVVMVVAAFWAGRKLSSSAQSLGGSLFALVDLLRLLREDVPSNLYGICTGLAQQEATADRADEYGDQHATPQSAALIDWLQHWIKATSGLTEHGGPLTFADLHTQQVSLQMVTTNLSLGRPYIVPFAPEQVFLFQRGDMEQLFPGNIVAYLCQPAHLNPGWSLADLNLGLSPEDERTFFMLPNSQDLPVLVGMRLSLSFPLLISAVRLYTISASCPQVGGEYRPRREDIQPNWFSDGGICSNFPIHFFDSWLPTHPTFGINLTALPKQAFSDIPEIERGVLRTQGAESAVAPDSVLPEYVSQVTPEAPMMPLPVTAGAAGEVAAPANNESLLRDAILGPQSSPDAPPIKHMPQDPNARVLLPDAEQRLDPIWKPISGVSGFVWSMFDTAMSYRDNAQLMLPSYKERAVQIRLDGTSEGGLNLTMPHETMLKLQGYGREAGELLRDRFDFDRHRWVRFRVLMAELERQILGLGIPLNALGEQSTNTFYDQLINNALQRAFPFSTIAQPGWVSAANTRLQLLRTMIEAWQQANQHDSTLEEQRIANDLVKALQALTQAWKQDEISLADSERQVQQLIKLTRSWQSLSTAQAPTEDRPAFFFPPVANDSLDLRVAPKL